MKFDQFPNYQSLEKGSKGSDGKANRSIPDRVEDYGLMDYVKPHHSVLDLGCNRGYFGTFLSEHIKDYTGLEASKGQLSHAIKRDNMRFLNKEFDGNEGQFDIILCLAFHSYVGMSMERFAKYLDGMCKQDGVIFLEGHPHGYREEPGKYLNPLIEHLSPSFSILENRQVTDRGLKRPFYILQKMVGAMAKCVRKGGKIYKIFHDESIDRYANRGISSHKQAEIKNLKLLKGQKHAPQIISHDKDTIIMSDCGDRIGRYNIPEDWEVQCGEIDQMQRDLGLFHFDVELKNICVKDGVIYLIDWGSVSGELKPIRDVINELF